MPHFILSARIGIVQLFVPPTASLMAVMIPHIGRQRHTAVSNNGQRREPMTGMRHIRRLISQILDRGTANSCSGAVSPMIPKDLLYLEAANCRTEEKRTSPQISQSRSFPSHLSPRTRLNFRYNYRHSLRLQGLKREKKEPGKDAVGLLSSIRVPSMSYDWPGRAAARYIASQNAVMRCIGRAFIHFAVYLRHSGLNSEVAVWGANCLSELLAPKCPGYLSVKL